MCSCCLVVCVGVLCFVVVSFHFCCVSPFCSVLNSLFVVFRCVCVSCHACRYFRVRVRHGVFMFVIRMVGSMCSRVLPFVCLVVCVVVCVCVSCPCVSLLVCHLLSVVVPDMLRCIGWFCLAVFRLRFSR